MLSSGTDGERRNAFAALLRTFQSEGVDWCDIGNVVDPDPEDDGKYTEAEMQEYGQAARAEGIEAGIKIGLARAANGNGNGGLTLPPPGDMAEFCAARRRQLKDDNQRKFIDEMVAATHNQMFSRYRLRSGQLGYLASLYIQHGGSTS